MSDGQSFVLKRRRCWQMMTPGPQPLRQSSAPLQFNNARSAEHGATLSHDSGLRYPLRVCAHQESMPAESAGCSARMPCCTPCGRKHRGAATTRRIQWSSNRGSNPLLLNPQVWIRESDRCRGFGRSRVRDLSEALLQRQTGEFLEYLRRCAAV